MISRNDTAAIEAAYRAMHKNIKKETEALPSAKLVLKPLTDPVPVTDAQDWVRDYLDYYAKSFRSRGWLVNNSELKKITNDNANKYTHISLAWRRDISPARVTIVLSGVQNDYSHHWLPGNKVLETVHPCPDCYDLVPANDNAKSSHVDERLGEAALSNPPRP